MKVIHLSHCDDCCLYAWQVWADVSQELTYSESVSLRNGESLPGQQPPNKPNIKVQGASFNLPPKGIGPIEHNQPLPRLIERLNGIGQRPNEGIEPTPDILNIIQQQINPLQLIRRRGLPHPIQTIHLYTGLLVNIIRIPLTILPVPA